MNNGKKMAREFIIGFNVHHRKLSFVVFCHNWLNMDLLHEAEIIQGDIGMLFLEDLVIMFMFLNQTGANVYEKRAALDMAHQ